MLHTLYLALSPFTFHFPSKYIILTLLFNLYIHQLTTYTCAIHCFWGKKSEVRNLKLETGFWVPVTMWSLYLPVENLPEKKSSQGFLGGWDDKESACKAGDLGSIPGWGRSPGEGNGNPLHYSCLGNSVDREAWQATVHGEAKSWTWLSDWAHM